MNQFAPLPSNFGIDVNGKLHLSKDDIHTTNDLIDASGLADGIYILTVTTNHQTETLKFVVNKNGD